mmetsp:Transcript_5348/g.11778  ORF Transcript_5348/g.11778 Transcript_5348/m.11778 type:complete len:316 (+) Transcript_5348:979-1926(+)
MPITYPHEVSEHTSPCHAPNVTGNHVRSDPVFRALLGGNRSKKLQDGIVVVGKNGRERDGLLHELDHSGGRRGGNDRIGRDAKVQRGALQQTVHQLDHHHDELVLAQIVSRLHEDAITLELGRYCHEAVVVVVVVVVVIVVAGRRGRSTSTSTSMSTHALVFPTGGDTRRRSTDTDECALVNDTIHVEFDQGRVNSRLEDLGLFRKDAVHHDFGRTGQGKVQPDGFGRVALLFQDGPQVGLLGRLSGLGEVGHLHVHDAGNELVLIGQNVPDTAVICFGIGSRIRIRIGIGSRIRFGRSTLLLPATAVGIYSLSQ